MNQELECKVLLVFLSANVDKAKTLRFEELRTSDWENVRQQAKRHGVAPLLYQRIKNLNKENSIPSAVRGELREAYVHSLMRNIRLFQELTQVLKVLNENDIPAVIMKGVYLAKFVYENIALRPMSDIDLLVKTKDFPSVIEKLSELHYHSKKLYGIEERSKMSEYLPPFIKNGAFPIDIHLTVEKPNEYFTLNIEDIWENANSVALDNVKLMVLSKEDMILHLCLHASFLHKFRFGLRALCDISETVNKYQNDIDWNLLQERASEWRIVKYIYLTLMLTKDLLDSPIPNHVLEKMRPQGFDLQITELAKEQIFRYRNSVAEATPFSANLVQLFSSNSLKEKLFLLVKTVFPPPKFIAQKYSLPLGSLQVYLYYPVRLKDIIFRYSRSAWGLISHNKTMTYLAQCERDQNRLDDWLA